MQKQQQQPPRGMSRVALHVSSKSKLTLKRKADSNKLLALLTTTAQTDGRTDGRTDDRFACVGSAASSPASLLPAFSQLLASSEPAGSQLMAASIHPQHGGRKREKRMEGGTERGKNTTYLNAATVATVAAADLR